MRKLRFIAHVGMGKTGTSAIQSFLQLNRIRLDNYGIHLTMPQYEYRDVFRVCMGIYARVHYPVELPALRSPFRREEIFNNLDTIAVLSGYRDTLMQFSKKHILLSDEGFACFDLRRNVLRMKMLSMIFEPFSKTHELIVIVYFRRQDDAIQSLYQQWYKPLCFEVTFDEFKDIFPPFCKEQSAATLDYSQIRQALEDGLQGRGEVVVRSYDLVRRGQLLNDFRKASGIEQLALDVPQKSDVNKGISNLAIRLLQKGSKLPEQEKLWLLHLVQNQYKMQREVGQQYPFLTLEDARALYEHYRISNMALFGLEEEIYKSLFAPRESRYPVDTSAGDQDLIDLLLKRLLGSELEAHHLKEALQRTGKLARQK